MEEDMDKIKYNLKLVSLEKAHYASTGEVLELHYQIFNGNKAVWGQKEALKLDTTKNEVKAILKQALDTYTQEHQPLSPEAKERLENIKKSDTLIKDLKGYQL